MRIKLPQSLVTQAREFEAGVREPVEPRDAATVVLMRDSSTGPEVYLLHRQASMAFAAGMAVFPGGGVDKRDFDAAIAWAGPAPAEWAGQLGTDDATARALVCAAVRETFEESGVLLAGPSAAEVVADTTGEDWEVDRKALEKHELAFTEFLDRRGLVLRTDLLGVWSGWLTPVFEPRRYRTWFFVAALPQGQRTRDVSTESSSVEWRSAMEAADTVDGGDLFMLPPTYATCLEVAQSATVHDVLSVARSRKVDMFTPSLERLGEVDTLSVPDRVAVLLEGRG